MDMILETTIDRDGVVHHALYSMDREDTVANLMSFIFDGHDLPVEYFFSFQTLDFFGGDV